MSKSQVIINDHSINLVNLTNMTFPIVSSFLFSQRLAPSTYSRTSYPHILGIENLCFLFDFLTGPEY